MVLPAISRTDPSILAPDPLGSDRLGSDPRRSDPLNSDPLGRARAALQASAAKVALSKAQFRAPGAQGSLAPLSLGGALDAVLPDGGLPWGQVIELCAAQPSGATRLSLLACARAQAQLQQGDRVPFCAFIDPFASLYAPAVAQAGVKLEQLVVVRPPLNALSRISVRLVEAKAFAVVVIDACALNAQMLGAHSLAAHAAAGSAANDQSQVNLSKWPNVVRRLNMALQGTQSLVLLLTNQSAYRPLSLPVGMRLDLSCPKRGELTVQVAKEKYGRISMPRTIRSFK